MNYIFHHTEDDHLLLLNCYRIGHKGMSHVLPLLNGSSQLNKICLILIQIQYYYQDEIIIR